MSAKAMRWIGAAALGLTALGGCSDALEQNTTAGQVVAVVELSQATATLVSAANQTVSHTIPVPFGTTGLVSGRGSALIAPGPGVVVMDLAQSTDAVTRVVPIAPGAPVGAAIQNDSVAWAAYSLPSAVWRVNYRTSDTVGISLAAGHAPAGVAIAGGAVFVVTVGTGGASWLTVLDTTIATGPTRITILDSIPLTGLGAYGITVGADGYLYIPSGGSTEGRLAIVDPALRRELAVINGLGDSLGPPVYHPSGRVLIPSVHGILEVNAATRSLTLGPSKGIKPSGTSPRLLAVDQSGRVYAAAGSCMFTPPPPAAPGAVYVLSPPPEYKVLTTIPIGNCPTGMATATVP